MTQGLPNFYRITIIKIHFPLKVSSKKAYLFLNYGLGQI